jgi:calpain-7
MRAATEATSKLDASRMRSRCQQLIKHAEQLKIDLANRPLTPGARILQRASKLHGSIFPPWEADPADVEFESASSGDRFTYDKIPQKL